VVRFATLGSLVGGSIPVASTNFPQRGPLRDFRGIRKIPSQKFRSRSPDAADKSCRKKFLIT
jgi:hypothetical protein